MTPKNDDNLSQGLAAVEKELELLSTTVKLEQVNEILLMYCQALTGTEVKIESNEGLKQVDAARVRPDIPATDGSTIFLPVFRNGSNTEEENFVWYKTAVTHQNGHIEFGTFGFSFEKEAGLFDNQRQQLSSLQTGGLNEMDRFLALFDDRKLGTDIFTTVEDTRVDYLLKREYAGLKSSFRWLEGESLLQRPSLSSLPLREAILEVLIRVGLGGYPRILPLALRDRLQSAIQVLRRVQSPEATVEDSAEATLRLYRLISPLPNRWLAWGQWDMADSGGLDATGIAPVREDWRGVTAESGTELPYRPPREVEFRGDFVYGLAQAQPQTDQGTQNHMPSPAQLSSEASRTLANEETQQSEGMPGEQAPSALYVNDSSPEGHAEETSEEPSAGNDQLIVAHREQTPGEKAGKFFYYDEWDFQAGCYRPQWCRVIEKPVEEGDDAFFEATLARNYTLAARIRREFEMLAPQSLNKLHRLHDGEEFNLDAVIEAVIERKAGHTYDEKLYWKKIRIQRDVAVLFLLDMSASTAEARSAVGGHHRISQRRAKELPRSPRRVIDVAKDSLVLMINAMETIGDDYGVYGFSSYGRENVELLVIKGIEEKFSPIIGRRIDRVAPLLSTRMGPAIRHASSKLEKHEARTKILFLISDGYPQDKDYGPDNDDKEYALHDTRMALIEARQRNITPFCLTIDLAGYDYLKRMSQSLNYQVVRNIESLPQRLPMLYKRLTS